MTRADWMASTPKCPAAQQITNMGRAACGKPLRWAHLGQDGPHGVASGVWLCGTHGRVFDGVECARALGFARTPMRIETAA